MTQCQYTDEKGRCPEDVTRTVDSRALGRPDASLEVCGEHYFVVKRLWLDQAAAFDGPLPPPPEEPCEGC